MLKKIKLFKVMKINVIFKLNKTTAFIYLHVEEGQNTSTAALRVL
jgi:hypothetical protein